jgi:hypothetical protein
MFPFCGYSEDIRELLQDQALNLRQLSKPKQTPAKELNTLALSAQ